MSTLFSRQPDALSRLWEHDIVSAETLADIEAHSSHTPAWLAVMQGFAAWVAACMVIVSFGFLFFVTGFTSFGISGAILIGVAMFLFYNKDGPFSEQLALAFSLAGQVLVTVGMGIQMGSNSLFMLLSALLAAGLTFPRSTMLHRTLCSLLALSGLASWICIPSDLSEYLYYSPERLFRLEFLCLLFAAMTTALWLRRETWTAHVHAARFKALAHAGMLINFLYMGSFSWLKFSLGSGADLPFLGNHPVYSYGSAALFLFVCFRLSRKLPLPQRVLLFVAALVVAVATHDIAPWILVCASLALAAFHACSRLWFAVSLLVAVWLLGQFYYSMEVTLLVKSGVLALSGGLLLALRVMLQRWQRETI
jgi:hypothetical protein